VKYKFPVPENVRPHNVVIEPHNPDWFKTAAKITAQLHKVLGENLLNVEHFGSTSIPGLAAKPVIDLLPIVRDINKLEKQKHLICNLGYDWLGEFGIAGRRFCTLTNELGVRLVHLHFYKEKCEAIKRHLAFRDYLLAYPAIAKAYEKEKRRAMCLHPHDSFAYNDEKSEWIQLHEKDALNWYDANLTDI
jgi:GrpB-like predicted nucleotidyltransferase (UPF0157 family)